MNFNSFEYLLFLPAAVLVYYLLPWRLRNGFLLACSYFFYMCWVPEYALLMLFSTAATYLCARKLARDRRKRWLVLCLAVNLGILFLFKYFNFLSAALLSLLGRAEAAPALRLLLPVGISFYIFQALGYTIDVYRGDIPAERNFLTYALFVSFFPQLVAGPIERAGNLLPQFHEVHPYRPENISQGMFPILWGLFKKMVVADRLAVIVDTVFAAPGQFSGPELAVAAVAFSLQIYCDFSAYSDIARGSARLLGFRLMQNFDAPYLSASVPEFWRRWHISLSSWFKDYVYFPLGGSRCAPWKTDLNLLLVFLLSGLWHGAAWTFVVWGLVNGVYQVLSRRTRNLRERIYLALRLPRQCRAARLWQTLVTFALICAAFVIFRADSLADAFHILKAIAAAPFHGSFLPRLSALGLSGRELLAAGLSAALLLPADLWIARGHPAETLGRNPWVRYGVFFLFLAVILIFGVYGSAYDPQEFVYFQF